MNQHVWKFSDIRDKPTWTYLLCIETAQCMTNICICIGTRIYKFEYLYLYLYSPFFVNLNIFVLYLLFFSSNWIYFYFPFLSTQKKLSTNIKSNNIFFYYEPITINCILWHITFIFILFIACISIIFFFFCNFVNICFCFYICEYQSEY